MANVSAIKLPSGVTYTLKDKGALQLTGGAVTGPVSFNNTISVDDATIGSLVVNGSASFTNGVKASSYNGGQPMYFVKGTQTAATNVWTGNLPSEVTSYYDGLTIDYFLPYAGNSTAATLNLSGLGAKPVYVGNTATSGVTTHYSANTVLHLTYVIASNLNSGNGCWKVTAYQNSTYWYTTVYCTTAAATAAKAGACSFYKLAIGYFPLTIQYANTSASALTLNINSKGAKPIYINGTASSASNYTLPEGQYIAYYDGTNYHLRTDGKIPGNISGDAATVGGHTVGVNVPSTAKFTDTTYSAGTGISLSGTTFSVKLGYTTSGNNRAVQADSSGNLYVVQKDDNTNTTYTFANGTNGFTVTPSGGSAQTVTVTPSITNNITGSGTSGYLAKFNGANTITNGPALGSATTTYLRNDGSWATPTNTTYSAGTGLRLSGTQFINTKIPFVAGTQTAATGSWTGVCNDITALYDGLTIAYWLPYAGSGNATLNLTINGTATGAKNCYYGGTSRLTTHYGAGNIIYLTYQSAANINGTSYEGWWAQSQYYSNTISQLRWEYSTVYAGTAGIFPYTLIMKNSSGNYESIVTSSSTGTSKAKNTVGFIPGEIFYNNLNATTTNGNKISAGNYALYYAISGIDLRYSANISTTALTVGKSVYLKGTITNGLFYLADTWWTQTLPTSDDGFVYIYLGGTYNYATATTDYRVNLTPHHPMFWYKNGALRPYGGDAATINGLTVQTAVPSGAKFTDTVTTATTSGSGNAVTAISASNGALTVTKGSTFLTSHQTVTNKAATLSYGSTTTIATIGSTNITVTMPAAPTAVWG